MESLTPQQGQYFSIAPPLLKPRSWLIPLSAGAIALIGALFVSAGQPPAPSPKPSIPPVAASSQVQPAQVPPVPAVAVIPTPQTTATPLLPTNAHTVNCDRTIGINFRRYPSLDKTAIVLVIPCGQPLTVTGEQVRSDGVTWLAAQYQQQSGWVAAAMIGRG